MVTLHWRPLDRRDRVAPCLHRRFEENDLPLLTRLRATMPNDTRIAFYRAHTLWAMHRFQDAYAAYDVRLNMTNVSRSNPVRFRLGSESIPHLAEPHPGPGHSCCQAI